MATMVITQMAAPPVGVLHLIDGSPERRILAEVARLPIWSDEERARLTTNEPLDFLELADLLITIIEPASERGVDLETYTKELLECLMEKRPREMAEMNTEEVLVVCIELLNDADLFVEAVGELNPLVVPEFDLEERLAARQEDALDLVRSRNENRRRIRGLQEENQHLVEGFNGAMEEAAHFNEEREAVTQETQALAALADKVL
ncbi:MAG: hypothetical protein KBC64_00855 [Simkaniaceae bacterium]|nr:hypothetical protein [Simkaniaceae bacterium]